MADKIIAENFFAFFSDEPAVKNLTLSVRVNEILGIIGPSNSGKTTFLRAINRMNDLHLNYRAEGRLLLDGRDVGRINTEELRTRVGMVFALPLPLPLTIYENVAYGPRRHGIRSRRKLDDIVERTMRDAAIWDEIRDRLKEPAMNLSGGQQQRLCIARTLAVEPEVILFDEPCSGLDPISTAKVEEAMVELKKRYTIVLVTNNVKQASRVSDRTAFFLMGDMVEVDETSRLFLSPRDKRTEDYITGRFG